MPVLVAHDFDKSGIEIAWLLGDALDGLDITDIGLNWNDLQDDRWVKDAQGSPMLLSTQAESVTYTAAKGRPFDPRPNLIDRDATQQEIDFLCSIRRPGIQYAGHRGPVRRPRRSEPDRLAGGQVEAAGREEDRAPHRPLAGRLPPGLPDRAHQPGRRSGVGHVVPGGEPHPVAEAILMS